mmetsp:Transcript_31068/g.63929  ORF Transcript_31068/g.63929 Transcript_31068/m.63929 type:complete len:250 (-) Transcript_31068:1209-1958(-)
MNATAWPQTYLLGQNSSFNETNLDIPQTTFIKNSQFSTLSSRRLFTNISSTIHHHQQHKTSTSYRLFPQFRSKQTLEKRIGILHKAPLTWRNHTRRQLRRNRPPLLNYRIAQKHGHHILMMIKISVFINIAQIPNLSQLIFLQPSFDQNFLCHLRREETTHRSQGFERCFESLGTLFQRPIIILIFFGISKRVGGPRICFSKFAPMRRHRYVDGIGSIGHFGPESFGCILLRGKFLHKTWEVSGETILQ